ncbi:MAG: rhodanese-related sulfurtransferase [Luteibaculaceae bacterium]|jgi:rhodanese-related sulfurtransferase
MKSITALDLKSKLDNKEELQIIDVREPNEAEICSMGGILIPMGDILNRTEEIRKDVPVIVHCRSGKRSANVIAVLEQRLGFENLYNLEGGILGYGAQVDSSISPY